MESSTLLYIAWPLTLGLSFMAGGMILSNESTPQNSKVSNHSAKSSQRNSPSNSSINENSALINHRSSAALSRASQHGYTESYNITEIIHTSDPKKRLTKLLSLIDQLEPDDFEQIVTDFRGLYAISRERMAEYELLLSAWAKINPEEALAYAKKNTSSTHRRNTLLASKTILSTWAEYAPDAAIQWVKLNHEGDKASEYLVDVIKGIASADPERATNLLQELPFPRDRTTALRATLPHVSKLGTEKATAWLATIKDEKLHAYASPLLAASLAKKDPQATADWLQTLSAENLKASVGSVARVWAEQDPQAAANWLQTLSADNLKNSVGSVARAWAEQDIDKAAEWTNSLKGETRTNAASRMIGQFVSSNPNKAATWMKTMSGEPNYKDVVRSFIYSTARDHPETALANLDQVHNDRKRVYSRQMILVGWAAKDKATATQWMQSNNIDAAAQEKILTDATKLHGSHWGRNSK